MQQNKQQNKNKPNKQYNNKNDTTNSPAINSKLVSNDKHNVKTYGTGKVKNSTFGQSKSASKLPYDKKSRRTNTVGSSGTKFGRDGGIPANKLSGNNASSTGAGHSRNKSTKTTTVTKVSASTPPSAGTSKNGSSSSASDTTAGRRNEPSKRKNTNGVQIYVAITDFLQFYSCSSPLQERKSAAKSKSHPWSTSVRNLLFHDWAKTTNQINPRIRAIAVYKASSSWLGHIVKWFPHLTDIVVVNVDHSAYNGPNLFTVGQKDNSYNIYVHEHVYRQDTNQANNSIYSKRRLFGYKENPFLHNRINIDLFMVLDFNLHVTVFDKVVRSLKSRDLHAAPFLVSMARTPFNEAWTFHSGEHVGVKSATHYECAVTEGPDTWAVYNHPVEDIDSWVTTPSKQVRFNAPSVLGDYVIANGMSGAFSEQPFFRNLTRKSLILTFPPSSLEKDDGNNDNVVVKSCPVFKIRADVYLKYTVRAYTGYTVQSIRSDLERELAKVRGFANWSKWMSVEKAELHQVILSNTVARIIRSDQYASAYVSHLSTLVTSKIESTIASWLETLHRILGIDLSWSTMSEWIKEFFQANWWDMIHETLNSTVNVLKSMVGAFKYLVHQVVNYWNDTFEEQYDKHPFVVNMNYSHVVDHDFLNFSDLDGMTEMDHPIAVVPDRKIQFPDAVKYFLLEPERFVNVDIAVDIPTVYRAKQTICGFRTHLQPAGDYSITYQKWLLLDRTLDTRRESWERFEENWSTALARLRNEYFMTVNLSDACELTFAEWIGKMTSRLVRPNKEALQKLIDGEEISYKKKVLIKKDEICKEKHVDGRRMTGARIIYDVPREYHAMLYKYSNYDKFLRRTVNMSDPIELENGWRFSLIYSAYLNLTDLSDLIVSRVGTITNRCFVLVANRDDMQLIYSLEDTKNCYIIDLDLTACDYTLIEPAMKANKQFLIDLGADSEYTDAYQNIMDSKTVLPVKHGKETTNLKLKHRVSNHSGSPFTSSVNDNCAPTTIFNDVLVNPSIWTDKLITPFGIDEEVLQDNVDKLLSTYNIVVKAEPVNIYTSCFIKCAWVKRLNGRFILMPDESRLAKFGSLKSDVSLIARSHDETSIVTTILYMYAQTYKSYSRKYKTPFSAMLRLADKWGRKSLIGNYSLFEQDLSSKYKVNLFDTGSFNYDDIDSEWYAESLTFRYNVSATDVILTTTLIDSLTQLPESKYKCFSLKENRFIRAVTNFDYGVPLTNKELYSDTHNIPYDYDNYGLDSAKIDGSYTFEAPRSVNASEESADFSDDEEFIFNRVHEVSTQMKDLSINDQEEVYFFDCTSSSSKESSVMKKTAPKVRTSKYKSSVKPDHSLSLEKPDAPHSLESTCPSNKDVEDEQSTPYVPESPRYSEYSGDEEEPDVRVTQSTEMEIVSSGS